MIDLQLILQKLEQYPQLIVPICVSLFVLMKFLIFSAKLAFMPCGVNVRRAALKDLNTLIVLVG